MGITVTVKTYTGYDEENKVVTSQTAMDARTEVDPEAIGAACDQALEIASSAGSEVAQALITLEDSAKAALEMGESYSLNTVSEATESFANGKGVLESALENTFEDACAQYDKLQSKYNEEARSAVSGCAGVVTVKEAG